MRMPCPAVLCLPSSFGIKLVATVVPYFARRSGLDDPLILTMCGVFVVGGSSFFLLLPRVVLLVESIVGTRSASFVFLLRRHVYDVSTKWQFAMYASPNH